MHDTIRERVKKIQPNRFIKIWLNVIKALKIFISLNY